LSRSQVNNEKLPSLITNLLFHKTQHYSSHREFQLPTYLYIALRTGNSRQGAKGLSERKERLIELAIIALKVIKFKDG
jgi:hypothetical protein